VVTRNEWSCAPPPSDQVVFAPSSSSASPRARRSARAKTAPDRWPDTSSASALRQPPSRLFCFVERRNLAKQVPEQCAVLSAPEPIPYPDRVVIVLAVRSGCNVSIETERRIRGDERARVVDRLRTLGINVISRHPSRRRVATRPFRCPADLVAEVRRDERLLIIRELRREARISSALGLDSAALELAVTQLEK
jgi:hypothetical protein